MENAANRIALTGALDTLPEYSHTNHDRKFYRLMLGGRAPVRRGRSSARAGSGGRTGAGGPVLRRAHRRHRQLRSFNNRAPEGRRLIISVYAETVHHNGRPRAKRGVPRRRRLQAAGLPPDAPRARNLRRDAGGAPPIPAHGLHPLHPLGQKRAGGGRRAAGAKLRVTGRLQSRDYVKVVDGVSQTRTAYELSVTQAESRTPRIFWKKQQLFLKRCNLPGIFSSG